MLAAVLMVASVHCGVSPAGNLANEALDPIDTTAYELLARFVQISDSQIVDEESPGRLTVFADLSGSAWRPQEAYSTQLLDGMIRTINKLHVARQPLDFVVFTGDATDNAQWNELQWFITAFDGGMIDPLTGVDDRHPEDRPEPLLDPHQPFAAQGVYQRGVHGERATLPWYSVFGNHDRFSVGVFPIVTNSLGRRVSPLPLEERMGVFFPRELNPVGFLAWAPITPAHPGPPPDFTLLPTFVQRNPHRRYVTDRQFIEAHLASMTEPPGHGFDAAHPDRTWYSVSPAPGVRLLVLNSCTPLLEAPGLPFSEGAISSPQVRFLRHELESAELGGETVIVATHHPSESLQAIYGSAVTGDAWRSLLNEYRCVKLHVAGHWHQHAVFDRGGYVEMVTGSILDPPQEGRVIELWRRREDVEDVAGPAAESSAVELRYWTFSHLEDIAPPDDVATELFDDPLLPMRRAAAELADSR